MSASQPALFNVQEFTDAGVTLVGGRLYTYAYGTTALKVAYTDPEGTVPQTYTADGLGGQYIALNARGELPTPLYLGVGPYDMSLKRLDGSTVWVRRAEGIDAPTLHLEEKLGLPTGAELIKFLQAGAGAQPRAVQSKLRDFVTPEDFGAKGGGANDTGPLLAAVASGFNIYIASTYTYQDVTLDLRKAGQQLVGPGSLIQKSVLVSNVPANPVTSYAASEFPAIKLSAPGARVEVGSITAAWEGIQVAADNCFVMWTTFNAAATSWYDGILSYANNPTIIGNTVINFGAWPSGVNAYRLRGDGIFLSSGSNGACSGGAVAFNTVRGAAKNGLFAIGQQGWVAHGNIIEGCAMSAIQIAFLNGLLGGNASNFTLSGNVGRYCGADSIDINNSSGSANEALHASSTGNTFDENGFWYASRAEQLSRTGTSNATKDGAGYTLIAVSDFLSSGNYFNNCGRAVVLAAYCENLYLNDHGTKISSNPLDDTDGLRLSQVLNSSFKTNLKVSGNLYRAEGDCSGTVISESHWVNTVAGKMAITTPSETNAPEFRGNRVIIESGGFISNLRNPISACIFSSSGAGTAEIFGAVEIVDTHFVGGDINVSIIDPTELTLRGLSITANNSTSSVLQIRNCLTGHLHDVVVQNAGNKPSAIFYGSSANGNNWLRNTTFKNFGGGNSLRIEASVPASVNFFMDETITTPGFADLAGGTKKALTWA